MSNSGVIGDKQTPSTSSAGGVHTSQEIYTQLTAGTFPVPYQITMTGIPSSIDEGSSFTVSVSDSSASTYSLPYLLDSAYGNIEPADFDTSVTGNISMVGGIGTLVITLAEDGVTENEYFRLVTRHPVSNIYHFISGQIDITDTAMANSYRYWGIADMSKPSTQSTPPVIKDFRLYTGASQTGTAKPPSMTSNTAPSPYQVYRSYAYSSTYEAWKAVDSSIATFWYILNSTNALADEYLYVDMGSAVELSSVKIVFYASTYLADGFSIKGSNDQVNWTTVRSIAGNSSTTVLENF